MKAKKSALYECQHCGWQSSKWLGKCPNCNAWESLIELRHDYMHSMQQKFTHNANNVSQHAKALPITQVQEEVIDYFSSTQSELDIVLGGGIVRGGLYLIGGSPGVGKSTLLLKVAGGLANGLSSKEDTIYGTKPLNMDSKKNYDTKNLSIETKNAMPNANKEQNILKRENLDSMEALESSSKDFNGISESSSSAIASNSKQEKQSIEKANKLDSRLDSKNTDCHDFANAKSRNDDKIDSKFLECDQSLSPTQSGRDSKFLECTPSGIKSKTLQNLDSRNYHSNQNIESKLDSKRDFLPFSMDKNKTTESKIMQDNHKDSMESKNQANTTGKKVLYVSGEESLNQIYNRAKRCKCLSDNLYLLSEINILEIKETLLNGGFEVCIIDSIQTIYSPNLSAAPGSVSQVREITFELMRLAKSFNIAMFIIGHITKDGQIAGPRVLEHMVDCVLYFEGEKSNELKILRGFKNRFGTTSEIGIFEMREHGLVSANEATKKFFNAKKDMPGSAAVAIMEGSRCIVVEIQALTCENEFGVPKRLTNGFDSNRLNMILALLEKKLGIHLHRHDVFVNVAGGIKISETSADLALIASILSSYKNRPLKSSTAFIGEVSLIGDIREVGGLELRLKELANFGFKNAIVPNIPKSYKGQVKCVQAMEVAQIIEWM